MEVVRFDPHSSGRCVGCGSPRTKRTGWAAYAASNTCRRCSVTSAAWPQWTVARGHHSDRRVVVFMIVPVEKWPGLAPGILKRPEPLRRAGPVLQRLELRLRKWVVVRHSWPRVALGHPQSGQQQGHRFGVQGIAPVGVKGQLPRLDPLFLATGPNQLLRQAGRFPFGKQAAHYIAAEDIQIV